MQTTFSIGARALCIEMHERMRIARVNVPWSPTDEAPWLPNGSSPSLVFDSAQPKQAHVCQRERIVHLPFVLVFPFSRVWERYFGKYWSISAFRPYWVPMLVVHEGVNPPDGGIWRPATVSEVVSGVAQYPAIGSLRCYDRGWPQPSCQTYHFADRDHAVILDCQHSPPAHHAAYVSVAASPTPPRELQGEY